MANGLFAGGDGGLTTPYLIEDAFDLNAIRNNIYVNYKLIKHIDMSPLLNTLDSGGFVPIPEFRGIIDGDGYAIKNMFMNGTTDTTNPRAFIKELKGGIIRNLGMINSNIYGYSGVSAFVDKMNTISDLIENCYIKGGTIKASGWLGGFVDKLYYGTVKNCINEAKYMAGDPSYSGGIFGILDYGGKVINCVSNIQELYTMYPVGQRIDETNGVKATISNVYYTAPNNASSGQGTFVSKADSTKISAYPGLDTEQFDHVNKIWILSEGSTPKLYFQTRQKYLIFVNNKYVTYKNGAWTDVSTTDPTDAQFMTYGLDSWDLDDISKIAYNQLKQYGQFDLVCQADKYKIDRLTSKKPMVLDRQIQDGVVLKTTLTFSELGNALCKVKADY